MEHLGLLGILVNLIVALWVAAVIYQNQKTYNFSFLRPFFHYCLIYSLVVFFGLVALYVSLNLQRDQPQERLPLLQDGVFLLVSLIEIGLVYSMFRIYLGFKGRDIPKRLNQWIGAGLSLFVFSYGLKLVLPQGSVLRVLNIFHGNVFDNILLFEILILILMLISGRKETDRKKIRLRRSFGWLFLLRYIVLTGTFVLFVVFISNADEIIPKAVRYPAALVCVLLFSGVPYVWIKYFFKKYADSLLILVEGREVLDSIFQKYGISRREQDILKMILDGKTNKEIEEALFISYHTVKNHVYNLYQKLGVKNRYDLVHFITTYQKEEGVAEVP